VVDADAICVNDSVKCIKNADGSYDFEILYAEALFSYF
jgi:hypothetical protein